MAEFGHYTWMGKRSLHNEKTDRYTLTAGSRYIRGCCLTLERRYGFRADAEWARRCFEKALDGKPCTTETQILHKNVSHIV